MKVVRSKYTIAVLVLAGLAGMFALSGQVAGKEDKKASEPESSWTVRCQDLEEGGKKHCEVFQRLIVQETGALVAEFAIGYPPGRKDARGVVLLPNGVLLQSDMTLQIDEQEPFSFSMRYCLNNGCYAYLNLNEAVVGMLRKGSEATFSFQDFRGQKIAIKMSLKGFTKALKEVKA